MKPFCELNVAKEEALVYITGIAYDKGASLGKGAKHAPKLIWKQTMDMPPFTIDGKPIDDIKLYNNGIYKPQKQDDIAKIAEVIQDDVFNLFIGGDHSVSIKLEETFYKKAKAKNLVPVIIHIDAHPDFCDFYDRSYYSHACPNKRAFDLGYRGENFTLIGIRGYEAQEIEFFKIHPEIKIYSASTILEKGINDMLDEVIAKYHDPKYAIYLSYDIDVNDPFTAPGTGTPENFGLAPYTTLKIIETLLANLNVEVMDIVEVSPKLDDNNNTTSWLVVKTLYEIFGVLIDKRNGEGK